MKPSKGCNGSLLEWEFTYKQRSVVSFTAVGNVLLDQHEECLNCDY